MKKFIIPVHTWKADVIVWLCSNEEAEKAYKKTIFYEYSPHHNFHHAEGSTFYEPGHPIVVWLSNKVSKSRRLSVAVHEFTHVTIRLLANKGLAASEETDEAYAYLMEYLIASTLKKL